MEEEAVSVSEGGSVGGEEFRGRIREFNVHLNDVKYIAFEKLKDLNLDQKNNLLALNILEKGKELQDVMRDLIADQRGDTEEAADTFKAGGQQLLCAYYLQYQISGCPEDEVEKFIAEKDLIIALIETMTENEESEDIEEEGERGRKYQTHPILRARLVDSFYETVVPNLRAFESIFHEYTKMSIKQFDFLLDSVTSIIQKDSTRRDIIPPDFRVLVTLRHLVAGDSILTLSLTYLLGKSTVREIISETCQAIWDALSNLYIMWPRDLKKSSEKWHQEHRFPHCVGAVDGKHIRIQKPAKSGSLYFNYKKFFSIVLMAVCDADCNFTYVSIGEYGSQSDASSWIFSSLGAAIDADTLNWPAEDPLPDSDIPFGYFLIGDEAFQLSKHMIRPFSGRNLREDERNFNERLSAARSTIERTFGILANRFRIFRQEIASSPENVELIVMATVTLHNFINKTRDNTTPTVSDCMPSESCFYEQTSRGGRSARAAQDVRNIYKNYLLQH